MLNENVTEHHKAYVRLLRRMLFSKTSPAPKCNDVLEKYQAAVDQLLIENLDIHTMDCRSEQLLYTYMEIIGEEKNIDVYAMPASEHTFQRLNELNYKNLRIKGFVDNYKTGFFHDKPVLNPSDLQKKSFDSVFILAQDYELQKTMRHQLQALLPPEKHPCLIMLGSGYLGSIVAHKAKMTARAKQINSSPAHMKIVFAVKKFPVNTLPMVREMRRQGHSVSLVVLDRDFGYGEDAKKYEMYFDHIQVCGHYFNFFFLLSLLEGDVLYTMDFSSDTLFCLLIRKVWKYRMVHEIYGFGAMLNVLIPDNVSQFEIDYRSHEMMIMENEMRPVYFNSVDGIIYRGSPVYENDFKRQYGLDIPVLHFPPYPDGDEKYSFYDNTPHIVWCGFQPGQGRGVINFKFKFFELIRDLVDQNIHFHMFNMYRGKVLKYLELADSSQFFHIEEPLPFDGMTMMLRRYDWGCMAFYFDENDPRRKTYSASFASRFFSYVSAGIPILCSMEYSFMADFVRKNKNGIVLYKTDIPRLGEILKDADMDEYRYYAEKTRKEYSIQARYPLLENFLACLPEPCSLF